MVAEQQSAHPKGYLLLRLLGGGAPKLLCSSKEAKAPLKGNHQISQLWLLTQRPYKPSTHDSHCGPIPCQTNKALSPSHLCMGLEDVIFDATLRAELLRTQQTAILAH